MFLHRDEEILAEFNVIATVSFFLQFCFQFWCKNFDVIQEIQNNCVQANGETVKLTNEHLIYVSDCDPKSPLTLLRYHILHSSRNCKIWHITTPKHDTRNEYNFNSRAKEVTTSHCLMAARRPVRTLRMDRVVSVTKVQWILRHHQPKQLLYLAKPVFV